MILETLVVGPKSAGAPTAMVFVLHGRGANNRDLVTFATALDFDTLCYVFVNAPLKVPGMAEGREWYRFDASHDQGLEESTERLLETIDV